MRGRFDVARTRPLLLVAVLAALIALGPATGTAAAVKVTFIGDSKAAGIELSARAKQLLSRGHDMRRNLKVCRRLVARSCVYQGVRPRSALGAIYHYGTSLGTVLVIDVGYNDSSATYRGQLDQVMQAALDRGVRGVVWVNLRAVRPDYRRINSIIRQAANRFPELYLANWNRYTRDKPASWFGRDGIHLTGAGAVGLVKLVRRYIPLAAQGPRPVPAFDYPTGRGDGGFVAAEATLATDLSAGSPPVGTNLGAAGGSSAGPAGFLVFAGGAALMLFLILVTVGPARRPRRGPPRSAPTARP